jgi:hypothetical protein
MKSSTVLILVGVGVVALAAYYIVSNSKNKAPPVSGAATGPASGSGIKGTNPSYGAKALGTVSGLLAIGQSGLDLYQDWKGGKPGMT